MTDYVLKFEVKPAMAEVRINAFFKDHKFASHSVTNDEMDWLEFDGEPISADEFIDDVYSSVPESEAEGLYEFLGSLDTYARQFFKETKVNDVWACNTCGAFTTDPAHRLITYFHDGCRGVV